MCDAFDAMVSDRAYRRALSLTDAHGRVRRCAGTQLHPGVLEAFCVLWAGAPVAMA